MNYRLLEPTDQATIDAAYKRAFGDVPAPSLETSFCAIAELPDGTIGGFLFSQALIHVEPGATFHPDASLNQLRLMLEEHLNEFDVKEYYSYTSDSRYDAAMSAAGYEPVGVLWRKRIV
jgi:hypothetical protein